MSEPRVPPADETPGRTGSLQQVLFGDREAEALFTGAAEIAAMIEVERALARAQGALGLLDPSAAAAVDGELAARLEAGTVPDARALAQGTAEAGVPVPALVAALREDLPGAAADALHFGATSQDIVDSALMLRLARLLRLYEARLAELVAALVALARLHRATPMAARTRTQGATPVSFGLRVANWALPLARALAETRTLARTGLPAQLGGASGDLAALVESAGAKRADMITILGERFAGELGLAPALPWMNDRTPIVRIAALLARTATGLEKMAADCLVAARGEAGEIRFREAGSSSTMPQKQNPVRAEAVVALARHARGLAGLLTTAPAHLDERDGAGWMGEWLVLPQLATALGAGLLQARALAAGLEPDPDRMREALTSGGGVLLAERLSFALIPLAGRGRAQALVKEAAARTRAGEGPLAGALRRVVARTLGDDAAARLRWEDLSSFETASAPAALMTDRLLDEIGRLIADP